MAGASAVLVRGPKPNERKNQMNLNSSPTRSRALRLPGSRPRHPGETRARLTRVAHHLVDLVAELTPLSPVPFRIERGLDQESRHTGGKPSEHRGAVPTWARARKEVRHG
jgi:hypothetical protein